MTEDNAGEMIDHLTDYLEGIEAIANKGFKTKNGKQQVNSLLVMITSLLNSLQLKEFDRERAHRAETLAELCGIDAGERTIDVQVTRLRRKLEEDSKTPRYLQTVRGKGYLLRAEEVI